MLSSNDVCPITSSRRYPNRRPRPSFTSMQRPVASSTIEIASGLARNALENFSSDFRKACSTLRCSVTSRPSEMSKLTRPSLSRTGVSEKSRSISWPLAATCVVS
jgi:hypothetical protein